MTTDNFTAIRLMINTSRYCQTIILRTHERDRRRHGRDGEFRSSAISVARYSCAKFGEIAKEGRCTKTRIQVKTEHNLGL